jgi:putative membrane protein
MSGSAPTRDGERLHALSWLFVLMAQLWNLLPLLLTVLIAGRLGKNDGWELIATLIAAVTLSAYSMFYTFSFRFWVEADEIVVKEGLFDRTLRHVPFTRIQNVAFRQSLLHRVFGVVELNLESGAGTKPEAKLTVLPKARATLLEQQIRGVSAAQTDPISTPDLSNASVASKALPSAPQLLHQVPLSDLLRLGLISNRGVLLIGAAFYFLNQTRLMPTNLFKTIGRWVRDSLGVAHGPLFWLLSGLCSLLLILLVVRIASILHAIYSFYDFKLSAEGERLQVEHGLITRLGGGTRANRIVAFLLRDGWLYRYFHRQSVEVILPGNSAADAGNNQGAAGMRYLSPIAAPEIANQLIQRASEISLAHCHWQPLHALAWRRMLKWPLLFLSFAALAAAGYVYLFWPLKGLLLLLLGYSLCALWLHYSCKRNARASGFVLTPSELIIRAGYFSQTTLLIPRREIQSVSLSQSPFDRTHRMANVHIDLRAGSLTVMPEAVVNYLPDNVASALARVLRRESAQP